MSPINRHQLSPNQKRSGVFISYARSDGSEFAHQLRQLLEQQNIKVWMDRTGMEGNHDWWLQITEAIHGASFLLIVLTPGALESKIVHDEWRYARQEGVCVYIIKGSPDVDYSSLPRWMRNTHCYDLGSLEEGDFSPEWPKFLNDLQKTPEVRRVPFMVEDLPANHVHRSEEFDQLIALLLDRMHEEPVAITAALRGAGGYGKTTIAKSLCHNEDIQDAFDDGILWVTLGETPGDLTGRVEDLIQTISGERPGFSNLEAAITRFTELLADRDILLVIDDVWNRDHLRPFLQGGKRCARLITTRNLDTLPPQAQQIKVDAMRAAEAVKMLSVGLPDGEIATCDGELIKLAMRLGEWPLLLGLAGAALKDRVQNTNQSLPEAISYVNRALDKRGLAVFDARDTESRNQAVAKTIGVSLDLLKANERARYDELAVFPEDVNIPLPTLGKFWASTGATSGFDAEFDTEELCTRLNRLSLLHTFDAKERHIRLHDVVRQYLIHEQRGHLTNLHNQLLSAHRPAPTWSALTDDEPYFWEHLAFHLIEARRGDELVATVKDWHYLARKTWLRKSLAVENDLLQAEQTAPADDVLRTLRRSFANTGHLFNHCETRREVKETLYFRLQHLHELKAILQGMAQSLERPHVAPLNSLPDLPHPALIRTLEGHSREVNSCAFSPDNKLIVSASNDYTLKVWEAQSGALLRTLEGHSHRVRGCAFSPDGKLVVSASNDYTLKVWEAHSGALLSTLEGHSGSVNGCAFSPDNKLIVSASMDKTLKVWEVHSGAILLTLKGHSDSVNGCAFSPDGKLVVSASNDYTLKVWEMHSGAILLTLEGHSDSVNGCAFSPDGKLVVSASNDHTLKVWDIRSGQLIQSHKETLYSVNSCAVSLDGKLMISASNNRSLKSWDAQSGQLLSSLKGHSDYVNCCAFSFDGKLLVSASDDHSLKVWDAQSVYLLRPFESFERLSLKSFKCSFSPDGSLIFSDSSGGMLDVWNARSGQLLHSLKGHRGSAHSIAESSDGRLIILTSTDDTLMICDVGSGRILRSFDEPQRHIFGSALSPDSRLIISCPRGVIKVSDAQSGKFLHSPEGHNPFSFSPDGKLIVSASSKNHTLKVWDAQSGQLLCSLNGHSDVVNCCAFSPDGKLLVSASNDHSLKVWDAQSGQLLYSLEGHSDKVSNGAFSPDGKLIISVSADLTLKVWDTHSGRVLHSLEGHSHTVIHFAFSPYSELIVSASNDRTLKVWETQSGQCIATFYADGPLECCAIFGEMIVAGGARGIYFLRLVQ